MATEYRGGRWFDGTAFVPRPVWADGARLAFSRPAVADVVDIGGGYVVPPYGDGHTHWLEPDRVDTYVADCVRDGVLYVKDHATSPRLRAAVPDGPVTYVAANQGFTSPDGHPFPLFAQLAEIGVHAEDAAYGVASEADVDRVWPEFLAGAPDFVKVFLGRGIDPALVPGIVRRAHAASLRVSAHTETAADVAVAVSSGVDDLAHLPFAMADDPERCRIADGDVAAAGRRRMTVATTLQWLDEEGPDERLDVTRDNVARLRAAGAVLTVGTDIFRATARIEADLLARYGLLGGPLDLLRAWCVDTPRAVVPDAGALRDGAAATFLVLGADPLADFAATADIRLRVRNGDVL